MMRSKKSQAQLSTLNKIIIVLVSFMIILGLMSTIKTNFEETTEGAACRSSIVARDKTMESPLIPNIESACETITHEISLEDYSEKDEVIEQVAKKMMNAWWMSNQGKTTNLWSDRTMFGGTQCTTLYMIELEDTEDKDFEEQVITRREIEEFLEENYYNDKYTYHNYIQVSGGTGSYHVETDMIIDDTKTYTISIASPDIGWLRGKSAEEATTILILSDMESSMDEGCVIM